MPNVDRSWLMRASQHPCGICSQRGDEDDSDRLRNRLRSGRVGLVASFERLTGVINSGVEVAPKQLELLHELIPRAPSIGLLVNSINRLLTERLVRDTQAAAGKLGLQLDILHASAEGDFDTAFAT